MTVVIRVLSDLSAIVRPLRADMEAKKFDSDFDCGKDITDSLGLSKACRPLQEQKSVNLELPVWMLESLDREAGRLGVTRQSIIKVWLAERLEQSGLKAWALLPDFCLNQL